MAMRGNCKAFRFIILLGIVSLFADITYEGARSITGPFLSTFGVSAVVVGFISGFGEFIGYALRLISGYIADRTGRYWFMAFLGYGLILAIPLLAFANHWEIVAILIIAERAGKAIRSPSRDAMLSFATKKVGRGWGFGIHEAMDQIGAMIGPLLFSSVFLLNYGYKEGFAILFIPAILALSVLTFARMEYPAPHLFESESKAGKLNKAFWLYTLFIFTSMVGFANFQLISYHLKVQAVFSDAFIPLLYAIAMGVDALFALFVGKTYDKIGMKSLFLIPLLTPLILLSFLHSWIAIFGILIWGAVMGMQETVMRAGIADLVSSERRGAAYGIFNTANGSAWFAGSITIGFLYDVSITYLTAFVVFVELVAFVSLITLIKNLRKH